MFLERSQISLERLIDIKGLINIAGRTLNDIKGILDCNWQDLECLLQGLLISLKDSIGGLGLLVEGLLM